MSSNAYGFTCTVPWKGRSYEVQVLYEGTHDDSWESLNLATADWETEDPAALAAHELEHRDWSKPSSWACSRIDAGLTGVGGWLPDDPSDPLWNPPQPTEREILQIIAAGQATDIEHGWDT